MMPRTTLLAVAVLAAVGTWSCARPAASAAAPFPSQPTQGPVMVPASLATPNPNGIYHALTGAQVQQMMQGWGYRAEVGTFRDGIPLIRSSVAGARFSVYFYECERDACRSLQFVSGFRASDSKRPDSQSINAWNTRKRWGKAHLDTDGDAIIIVDVSAHGVTEEHLKTAFERWEILLSEFRNHVYR